MSGSEMNGYEGIQAGQDAAVSVTSPGRNGGTLRPFQKGQSGNPTGRPKLGRRLSSALADLLDTPGDTVGEAVEVFRRRRGRHLCGADLIAITMFTTATDPKARGQVAAASEIADRTEGKVEQPTRVSGDGLTFVVRRLEASGDSIAGKPS